MAVQSWPIHGLSSLPPAALSRIGPSDRCIRGATRVPLLVLPAAVSLAGDKKTLLPTARISFFTSQILFLGNRCSAKLKIWYFFTQLCVSMDEAVGPYML